MLNDQELSRVSQLAHKQQWLQEQLDEAEQEVKKIKAELAEVSQVELPNLMAELHLSGFTLETGEELSVVQKYYASISAENKQKAFEWLRDNQFESIIKNVVKCEFSRGEDELANDAMQELVSLGLRPSKEENVHPMTLKSFVKDLFERGVDFPIDLFGAGVFNETKVVIPKKKK